MDPTGKKTEFMDWGLPPGVSPQNPFGLQLPPGEPDEEMQRVMAEWLGQDFGAVMPANHEKSVTVEIDGKWVNLPSVLDGKQSTQEEAVRRYMRGQLKPLGGKVFDSLQDALDAAKRRSREYQAPDGESPLSPDAPMSQAEPPDIIKLFVEGGFPAVAKMLRG